MSECECILAMNFQYYLFILFCIQRYHPLVFESVLKTLKDLFDFISTVQLCAPEELKMEISPRLHVQYLLILYLLFYFRLV